jgi:hypothetical protein
VLLIPHFLKSVITMKMIAIKRTLFPAAWRMLFGMLVLRLATSSVAQEPPAIAPHELVRRVVESEIKTNQEGTKYMCRERKQTRAGSETKLMVETRDAIVGMVVAYNDQPLDQEQRRAEYGRIERFVNEPAELDRKRRQEKESAERVNLILKALPDAFLYEYDGTEAGRPGVGKPGNQLIRLKFRPNPKYDPPSRVEQVLVGMQGTVLVDPKEQHLAQIDGTLFKDVSFGWGILGHLDRGGHFQVDQTEVGDASWTIARMDLAFTGKVLLFKSIDIKTTEVYNDFHPVSSNLTFAQGIQLLKQQQAAVAQNQPPAAK